jgi:hypothetical protein
MLVYIMYRACEKHSVCDCKCVCLTWYCISQINVLLVINTYWSSLPPAIMANVIVFLWVNIEILGTSCSVGWRAYWQL